MVAAKKWLAMTIAVLLIALCAASTVVATADVGSRTRTIRIGYLPNYATLLDPSVQGRRGYGYDMFTKIAEYTGWRYDYIPCTWDDGLQMLARGDIDVFGPMQKTPEREEQFLFTKRPAGYETAGLYAHKDADIYYNDTEFFANMRVGVYTDSFYNSKLQEYSQANGYNVTYVEANQMDSLGDLTADRYDVLLTTNMLDIPDTKLVGKIATEEFYYAVNSSKPEVIAQIDAAMDKMFTEDPYFYATLHSKYYGDKITSLPSFTKREMEMVSQYPVLRVAIEENASPIQYFDDETGEAAGIGVALLEAVAEETGIEFQFIPVPLGQKMTSADFDLNATFLDHERFSGSCKKSLPYHDVAMVFVGARDQSLQNAKTVGIVRRKDFDATSVEAIYGNLEVREYLDTENISVALSNGDIDLGLVSLYSYDDMVRAHSDMKLTAFPSDIKLVLELALSNTLPPHLVPVLDKSIARLADAEISSIVFSNTTSRNTAPTLDEIIRGNATEIVAIGSLLMLVLVGLIIANITANRAKRKVLIESENALRDAAYVDNLTGCPTILKFRQDAELALETAKPNEYMIVALDIDNFKYINDILGYDAGNHVLWLLTQMFIKFKHESVLMARVYADNFVFLYRKSLNPDYRNDGLNASEISKALSDLLGNDYHVNFSVGHYTVSDTSFSLSFMIDCANIAKKTAKLTYTNSIVEYTPEMDRTLKTNREIILAMEGALAGRQFIPYLQPKYSLTTGEMDGAEVLVRWKTDERGLVSPADFIPIFEKNGFISRLDLYMFEQSCMLLRRWLDSGLRKPPRISVNASGVTLGGKELVKQLLRIATRYNVAPHLIEIEVTESALGNSPTEVLAVMSQLKLAGFWVSIDDFGSGYSSFHLLKDASADVLKIDKGFLSESMDSRKGKEIIGIIIEMSQRLSMLTVAEGVETKEQADQLREMGCHIAQGYYYARPMPSEEFELLLQLPSNATS